MPPKRSISSSPLTPRSVNVPAAESAGAVKQRAVGALAEGDVRGGAEEGFDPAQDVESLLRWMQV